MSDNRIGKSKTLRRASAIVGLSTVGLAIALGAAGVFAAPPRPYCPCTVDGVCIPSAHTYGYYPTRWRRWPTAETTAAEEKEGGKLITLPDYVPPKPGTEDVETAPRGPSKPQNKGPQKPGDEPPAKPKDAAKEKQNEDQPPKPASLEESVPPGQPRRGPTGKEPAPGKVKPGPTKDNPFKDDPGATTQASPDARVRMTTYQQLPQRAGQTANRAATSGVMAQGQTTEPPLVLSVSAIEDVEDPAPRFVDELPERSRPVTVVSATLGSPAESVSDSGNPLRSGWNSRRVLTIVPQIVRPTVVNEAAEEVVRSSAGSQRNPLR